jgi:secretion/DNA translocation related CpaE-like protein
LVRVLGPGSVSGNRPDLPEAAMSVSPRASGAPPLPLLVTSDEDLLEDLLRLAAAGCTEAEVAPDPVAARPRYATAPLVLIGLDQAPACLRARLPQRPRTVVVGHSGRPAPGGRFRPPDSPALVDPLNMAPFEVDPRNGAAVNTAPVEVGAVAEVQPVAIPETLAWEYASLLGADHVAMLPAAEPWLVDRFVDARRDPAADGRVVAVIGGRGGAGASVLAAALAVTGVRAGLRTMLVDADPLGGGLDLVLGWEHVAGLRWPALGATSGRVDAPTLVEALPGHGELVMLSWDRGQVLGVPAESMATAMDAGRRGRELVVVDLPRRLDDAAIVALEAADHALLVVPAELRAAAAAARVAAAVGPHCPDVSVVVRGPAPSDLTAADVARALALPLTGALRPEPGLARALERGEPPAGAGRGPLAALCRHILADVVRTPRPAAA